MAALTGRPAGRPAKVTVEDTENATIPEVPENLGLIGRRVWVRLFSVPGSALDAKIDTLQAEIFCQLYEETEHMRKQLALGKAAGGVDAVMSMNKGQTLARHPYVQMVKDNRIMMNSILASFGFTPTDRAKLQLEAEVANEAINAILKIRQSYGPLKGGSDAK